MAPNFALQAGEELVRRDLVSFVSGPLRVRPGVCYLTTQRIVAEHRSLLGGAMMAASIIARNLVRKFSKPQQVEIPLRALTRVSRERYGVNPNVLALHTGGEPVLKIVMNARQWRFWMEALAAVLERQGKRLVADGERAWRVKLRA